MPGRTACGFNRVAHQLRMQALQRLSAWRFEERMDEKRDEASRENRAVIGHDVWINLHQPIGCSVAAVRPFLNSEAGARIFKSEGADDVQALLIEEIAIAIRDRA